MVIIVYVQIITLRSAFVCTVCVHIVLFVQATCVAFDKIDHVELT